jgi:predicted DNA-binding WGR domain protein
MQPDLFGGVLLVRQWDRIGARGRIVAERFESMTLAADPLEKHAQQKTRRGYGNIGF